MPQLLAMDWDEGEVRCAIAKSAGGRLRIVSVGSAPVPVGTGESPVSNVAQAILAALSGKKLGRCTVLVGMGRADVEFLTLTLPPAKESELPDLVAHEVLRQSPQVGDSAVVDFFPLNDDPSEPRIVSAAVCPAEHVERIVRCCQAAGLKADRILLRPHALLPLLGRGKELLAQSSLLVCRVAEEIDLAMVSHGRVYYARTIKLPKTSEEESLPERLLAEIRRTLLVVPPSEVGGGAVTQIYLFGRTDQQESLLERITSELTVPAMVVDPFAMATVALDVIPGRTDRFAPLIGMLQDEIQRAHPLDFLHPRKPPAPPNRRRQLAIVAAVIAVIAMVIGLNVWDSLQKLDDQNAEISQEVRELKKSVDKALRKRQMAKSIEDWQASSMNWLDELRDFSLRFPNSRDAVVLNMQLTTAREGGGGIDLNALVRDPAIVRRMETNIRDEFHQIRSKSLQERGREKDYSWHFDSQISLRPRSRSEYLAHFRGKTSPEAQLAGGNHPGTVPVAAVSSAANSDVGASPSKAPKHE